MGMNSIKALIRSSIVWKKPGRKTEWPVISEYELVESIYVSNTVYLVRIGSEYKYFRPIEDSVESLASYCRSVGTEELARLLGIERIHPASKMAELPGLGHGVLQDKASGISIMPYPEAKRREMLTPAFQREINDLNVLDVLCMEIDHSPNNYFVTLNADGSLAGLSVFDNNGRGTFACRGKVRFTTYKNLSPLVTEDGYVNRPHLCARMAEKLDQISFMKLFERMRRYLRPLPIVFLYKRIRLVKRAIKKTEARENGFLLDETEWNEETILEELNGNYGKTYLLGFLQDCVPHE